MVFVYFAVSAARSRADDPPGAGAWLLGLELQQRQFDTMSAGDSRPLTRADAGARLSIDQLLTPAWALGLSAHFGGMWLDWSEPVFNVAGKIEDVAWGVSLGVDRVFAVGTGGKAFAGVGVEYGETRSWLADLGAQLPYSQDFSDEGPHSYMTGGYARLAMMTPVWRRTALCAQVSESFYGAHATDPPFATRYNWLGRSLAVSVGLRFVVARGRVVDR
jgi:hypothetical protein